MICITPEKPTWCQAVCAVITQGDYLLKLGRGLGPSIQSLIQPKFLRCIHVVLFLLLLLLFLEIIESIQLNEYTYVFSMYGHLGCL